jgi:hypothetical protein
VRVAVAVFLLLSLAWAGTTPNPDEYTVNVHVSASHIVSERNEIGDVQKLNAIIKGKKYELESTVPVGMLLATGDYKAKLVKDEHKTTYDSYQVYEFLFADKKTRQFILVGQTE